MGVEIERKFLVVGDDWRSLAEGIEYRQGYLSTVKERTVRVRTVGDRGFLTIKGITTGATRAEFEYEIPKLDADQMIDELCERPIIHKTRYRIPYQGHVWEVDEFHGDNEGLILAEIELDDEDETFELPPWIGEEVTGDPRYFNANLVAHPYSMWGHGTE
jgi:CYTH domain-containing protein